MNYKEFQKKCIGRGKKKNRRGCKIMRNHKKIMVLCESELLWGKKRFCQ